MASLRQKTIFDQFNIPDLSGGTLDMNTSFMPGAPSPTYEDENTFRSSDIGSDFRTPEDVKGISSASNISKVSNASTQPKSVQDELKEYIDAVNSGYTPDTRSNDRLNKLLDETPDINNYNPSFMRKFASSLQSIKDPALGQKTLNQPYLQDFGQWKEKTAPFQAAATGENARNIQERTLVSNAAAAMTSANRADRQAQTAQDRITSQEKIASEKAEIARTRNNINAARNAQLEIKVVGDSVYGYDRNPNGKAPVYLGPSGGLDAADFLNARADANIRQAQATGGEVYFDSNGKPVIIQRNAPSGAPGATGGTQSGTGSAGSGEVTGPLYKPGTAPRPNALETSRERDAKLNSILENNNPDEVQFLKKDRNTGKVTFLPRPVVGAMKPGTTTFGFGGTPYTKDDLDRWDQLKIEIEPGYVPPQLTREERAAIAAQQQQPPLNPREAPIPKDLSFGNGPPASQQAPGQPPIQTPPTDRSADLVRMIQDPNTQPRARQMYQAELAQLQTNSRKQQESSQRDTTRANEITELLKNPNLGPRERQILQDQARGLPVPGTTPIGPSVPPPSAPTGPSPQQIQSQIAQIQAQMQNPGNSSRINQDLQMKINQLQSQLQQIPMGPAIPPGFVPPSQQQPSQQQSQGQPTNQQTDAQNPMMKRRSFDGGKTWQTSQDGGRTWR